MSKMKSISKMRAASSLLVFVLAGWIGASLDGEPGGSFLVSAQSQNKTTLELPKVKHAIPDSPTMSSESVVLRIPADDEYYIGKNRVKKADLPGTIRDLLEGKPPNEQRVFIKAAAALKY